MGDNEKAKLIEFLFCNVFLCNQGLKERQRIENGKKHLKDGRKKERANERKKEKERNTTLLHAYSKKDRKKQTTKNGKKRQRA